MTAPNHTTETNRELIATLWPRAVWGGDLAAFYRDQLGRLDQAVLAEAIRSVKRTRTTFADNPPELAWIVAAYNALSSQSSHIAAMAEADRRKADEREALERDEAATLASLLATPRERISEAVHALRSSGWIAHDPLPPSIAEWRSNTRSFVAVWIDSRYPPTRTPA